MSKSKKGLSFAEKQERLLAAIREKEIEKIGVQVGVVFQAIKEVLSSLIDDNLVKTDKVGSQNIYWSLKSEDSVGQSRKWNNLITQREILHQQKKCLEGQNKQNDERHALIHDITCLKEEINMLTSNIHALQSTGPLKIQRMIKELETANECSIRWGDNVCCVRSWLCSQLNFINEEVVNRQYEIPSDLR